MKLPVSNKTSGFGKRTHIKKGYYPGKFIEAKERTDGDDKPYEGQYGRQLIMEFAVYEADKDGNPTQVMEVTEKEEGKSSVTKELILPKFVYHMYKNRKTGELNTAITPNSAITKILKALGWTFDASKDVDIDSFKGNFVELNIDDYEDKDKDDKVYKASTIKDINLFEGEAPKESDTPKKKESPPENMKANDKNAQGIKDLEAKIDQLSELKKDGNLSEDGYKQAVEQINGKIEALKNG